MSTLVYVVSSNDISREGLAHFLKSDGFEILKAVQSSAEVDETSEAVLAVIDVPEAPAQIDALKDILARAPNARAVVLASNFDMDAMISCFKAGAQGYLVRSLRSQPLIAALRLASLGEKVMPSDLADLLYSRAAPLPAVLDVPNETALSPREQDVLCCLMAGYSNKHIARQLAVCEATVKVHVKAILRKLKVTNRTQAAIWANSSGFSEGSQFSAKWPTTQQIASNAA